MDKLHYKCASTEEVSQESSANTSHVHLHHLNSAQAKEAAVQEQASLRYNNKKGF